MGEEFHTIDLKELAKEFPDAGMGPDVIQVPHGTRYMMSTFGFGMGMTTVEDHRVLHQGGWYFLKGTVDGMDILDKIPAAVLKAEQEAIEAEEAKRVAEKGHDCWDNVAHDLYERDNGTKNDYYYCTICDDVLQVG